MNHAAKSFSDMASPDTSHALSKGSSYDVDLSTENFSASSSVSNNVAQILAENNEEFIKVTKEFSKNELFYDKYQEITARLDKENRTELEVIERELEKQINVHRGHIESDQFREYLIKRNEHGLLSGTQSAVEEVRRHGFLARINETCIEPQQSLKNLEMEKNARETKAGVDENKTDKQLAELTAKIEKAALYDKKVAREIYQEILKTSNDIQEKLDSLTSRDD
jgi:hypothetical protein